MMHPVIHLLILADTGFDGPWDDYIIGVGALAAALVAIFIFIERVWSPMKKWLQDALTTPLLDKLDEQNELLDEHREYVRYHLGPNGTATPIHERISRLEQAAVPVNPDKLNKEST